MNIGIIGSGKVGATLGRAWAHRNHCVFYSYSRDAEKLKKLAHDAGHGARSGSPEEAAQFGEVILLATPWIKTMDVLETLGDLTGKIVIDATNPVKEGAFELEVGFSESGAELIAKEIPEAHVIKAFNSTGVENLENPRYGRESLTMPICGDHEISKSLVIRLAEDLGFDSVDAGPLENARLLEPFGMLWTYLAAANEHDTDIGFRLLKR